MEYIDRDLQETFLQLSDDHPVVLVTGGRQVGKTTLLEQFAQKRRTRVSMADFSTRMLARQDPAAFLADHQPPLLVDDAQYAPELLASIKAWVDANDAPAGSFWIAGSQPSLIAPFARRLFGSRVGVLELPPLSQHELHGTKRLRPLDFGLKPLTARAKGYEPAQGDQLLSRIITGGMPGLALAKKPDPGAFFPAHLQSLLERDVRELDESADPVLFARFMAAAAQQTGQVLNIDAIRRETGLARRKLELWVEVLVRIGTAHLLQPLEDRRLKRAAKKPELLFADTGLACWLLGIDTPEKLEQSPYYLQLFQTYAINEATRALDAAGDMSPRRFYRDRDAKHVALILDKGDTLQAMQIVTEAEPDAGLYRTFSPIARSTRKCGERVVICTADKPREHEGMLLLSIWAI